MTPTSVGQQRMTPQSRLLALLLCGILLAVALSSLARIFLGPFLVALLLAYLSDPLFTWFQAKGYQRSRSVALCLLLTSTLGIAGSWLLMPLLINQFQIFFEILPEALDTLKTSWIPKLRELIERHVSQDFAFDPPDDLASLLKLNDLSAGDLLLSGLGAGTQILWTIAIYLIATPTFCYFFMRDFKRIQTACISIIPRDLRTIVRSFGHEVDQTVRSVLTGQIVVISLLSVAYATAFFVVGLPGGLAIGILTGLARIVPYLDILVGGTLSFLVLVTNGAPLSTVLGVVLSFIIIQLTDGLVLTPRIVGQFAGLHPVAIVVAVLVFADRFGFVGVLLAIPVTAIARVALGHIVKSYKKSPFYLAE